ncbi:hypothetical protein EDC01DRAFT_635239 [Geopyxis carbonaria]|nr:hypothetical protein EDC01DRAFT_635239 [Geopyxis carbonaria]
MHFHPLLLLAAAAAVSGAALPSPPAPGMRLIKTSDTDTGTWVTESEKFTNFTAQHIGFQDITDTLALESHAAKLSSARLAAAVFPSAPTHQTTANPLIAKLSQSNLVARATEMAAFYNRHYQGSYATTSATWMFSAAKTAAAANAKITVAQFTHSYKQPSVIAKIPGTSGKSVIVSAHFDSVGSTISGRAPGADDNASGVVAILEALRVLAAAAYAPTNTLEFHFYSGEEGGMLGSRDVMQAYVAAGTPVLAVVNQDMAGFSPNNVIAVYTDYVDAALTAFVKKLVPVYTALPLATDVCGYACSDHASARDAGYPVSYVCDENMADSSPYIHSAQDAVATVDFAHVLEHAKFTVGFLVEGGFFA